MSSLTGADQDIVIRSRPQNRHKDAVVFPVAEGGSNDQGIDMENNPAFDRGQSPIDLITKANKADMTDSNIHNITAADQRANSGSILDAT